MYKNLHIILSAILIPLLFCFILFFCIKIEYCNRLSGYDYDDLKIVWRFFKVILRFILSVGLGFLFFFLLKRFVPYFKTKKYLHVAFIFIVNLIFFYPSIFSIIKNKNNASIIHSLCNKSEGSSMEVKSNQVTIEEYQYLQSRVILFPDLPKQADSIRINYYHDGFLPDYSLIIEFRVPINTTINSNTKYWLEVSRNKNFKWIAYENGDS